MRNYQAGDKVIFRGKIHNFAYPTGGGNALIYEEGAEDMQSAAIVPIDLLSHPPGSNQFEDPQQQAGQITLRQVVNSLCDALDKRATGDDIPVKPALEPFFAVWADLPELRGIRTGEATKLRGDVAALAVGIYEESQRRSRQIGNRGNYTETRDTYQQQVDRSAVRFTAEEQIVRMAILDVIDGGSPGRELWHFYEDRVTSEDQSNSDRLDFCAAVVKRVRELKSPETMNVPGIGEVLTAKGLHRIAEHYKLTEQDRVERIRDLVKSPNDPVAAHLAAAEEWEKARHHQHCRGINCHMYFEEAKQSTARANQATKDTEPNKGAFHHTSAALLAASMEKPAEAADAHRRAALAHKDREFRDALESLEGKGLVATVPS